MKKVKKFGFTLVELVAAIAILTVVMGFAGVIFRVSVDSYRTAGANIEIMQKLRAITSQLKTDFDGFIIDAPWSIHFVNPEPNMHSDCIAFFATGDFSSLGLYDYIKEDGTQDIKVVRGNVAAIFYGHSMLPNPNSKDENTCRKKILTRRETILTSDKSLVNPGAPLAEYCFYSLAGWKTNPLDKTIWFQRSTITKNNLNQTVQLYMAKGVSDFKIECWDDTSKTWVRKIPQSQIRGFRFTFRLYDSKGILKGGRQFTYIVHI